MIMDKDKLTALFDAYDPDLSSDNLFMARLENNLKAVETVKQQLEERQTQNRRAIIVAALCGFVFGVLSVLCYPFIATAIRSIATPASAAAQFMSDYGSTVIWSAISLMAVILTYSAYDITLSLSKQSTPYLLRAK